MKKRKDTRTKEQKFDDMLVATIIATAKKENVQLTRGTWGVFPEDGEIAFVEVPIGFLDTRPQDPSAPVCCAVGAGILYAGLGTKLKLDYMTAESAFAKIHGVSYWYALGVSDGFEEKAVEFPCYGDDRDGDYWRGVSVGEAILLFVEAGNGDAPRVP